MSIRCGASFRTLNSCTSRSTGNAGRPRGYVRYKIAYDEDRQIHEQLISYQAVVSTWMIYLGGCAGRCKRYTTLRGRSRSEYSHCQIPGEAQAALCQC